MPRPNFKHEDERRTIIEDIKDLGIKFELTFQREDGTVEGVIHELATDNTALSIIAGYILEREDRRNV